MIYYAIVLTKFVIGFVVVISHLNFSGKTQLSQMTPVDFIGNFVLGGIIGGVIYSDAIPMHQYILVLLIGVSLISLLNWVSKHIWFFRSFTIGEPIPIIKNGKFLMDNILKRKNKIDILNVASQLHSQGIHSFQEIRYAQIEPSGSLSVVCEGGKMPSIILMKDGAPRFSELNGIEKDEDWLNSKLERIAVERDDIFIAEFWDGKLTFILKNGDVKRDVE
ncbi:DUF421 domain-containing protein [Erwinia pyrifoliae]|uniref:DUF421 domain-containing protein n=1 Tax=Erwinia pyrifoliae TaxID=79967 RepID=A0ABY5XC44_ERWPY|nr:YetF domain-containing protein [Erwinia pyrifoliae]AUX73045.1 DUF421 domain-containing protein [Erwinia pyrifoliae]MCA8876676.1 DUF421 domain-containing protein [Erwinia pyrifoliae]MCT2386835.1 DUF421 domain-containing protein [Erwinia pyrifoliae]MCU8587566.1 DUF421 domain-containing protein [Erwinia pyrifoliae]UWS31412.1 DUF421 domain-containing protein [Erwinia pyrifoliae]